jgi:hypothetical protein
VAAHGDVHRAFDDPRTNLERIDRMLAVFRAASLHPQGFSPPNSTYVSELGPLLERFSYVRVGYQERGLRFFPSIEGAGVVTSASYYPDFLHRYVGAEEYLRLLGRFLTWAAGTSTLAVPCFHPCLFGEPLNRFLDAPAGEVWETTLADVTSWWAHRRRGLAAVAAEGEGAAPPDVTFVRSTPRARIAALRPVNGEPTIGPRTRPVARVVVAGRTVRVVPAAPGAAVAVEVPVGRAWRLLGWLPPGLRRAASRVLVRVANMNGLHGCFYRELGLAPELAGGRLRLPVVAADEPLMLVHPTAADLARAAGRALRRLIGGAPRA